MPEAGERIKTPDGPAVVQEANILENKIVARWVLEEKSADKPEKLSEDTYTYKKQQITRAEKHGRKEKVKPPREEKEEELPEEIKVLLED